MIITSGDLVIQGFGKVLRNYTAAIPAAGRIGGEAPVFLLLSGIELSACAFISLNN